jgi:uncharacterized membrane protein
MKEFLNFAVQILIIFGIGYLSWMLLPIVANIVSVVLVVILIFYIISLFRRPIIQFNIFAWLQKRVK